MNYTPHSLDKTSSYSEHSPTALFNNDRTLCLCYSGQYYFAKTHLQGPSADIQQSLPEVYNLPFAYYLCPIPCLHFQSTYRKVKRLQWRLHLPLPFPPVLPLKFSSAPKVHIPYKLHLL